MKQALRTVTAALAPLIICSSAQAMAWAQLNLTGATFLTQSLSQSGSSSEIQRVPFTLRPGESQTFNWNYFISVADSGLPATLSGSELASYSMCNHIFPTTCPPAPTGYESAWAHLIVGHVDGRAVPPFLTVESDTLNFATARGPEADYISQSGSLQVRVSLAEGMWPTYSGSFAVVSDQWVVTSPVPEPEVYALMLAGLGGVGFVRRGKKLQGGQAALQC